MKDYSDDSRFKVMTTNNETTQTLLEMEKMYPEIYRAVYPEVVNQCNKLDKTYGQMYMPTLAQLEPMANEIYSKVEPQINKEMSSHNEYEKAQFGYTRRGFFNSFIGLILLGELFRRRRRFPRFPGYRRPYGPRRPFGPY